VLMPLVSLAVVGGLFVFLFTRSRRNPLFLSGAAAFLILGRSMFIDILPSQSVPGVPGLLPVEMGDVVLAVVALGWLYARNRRPVPRVRLSARWFALGVFFAYFLALELALSLVNASGLHPMSVLETRYWFYIPCGYLVALDVLRRFTLGEVQEYIRVLSILTTCLAVLYIASALNVPVYPYEKYQTIVMGSTTIIRDFTTVPAWSFLAWGYFLSQSKKNAWTFAALAVLVCAQLLTYTRSAIGLMIVTMVLVAGWLMVRRGRRRHGIVVVAAGAAVAVLALGPLTAVLPAQRDFLQSRFRGLGDLQSVLAEPNMKFRITSFETARRAGALADPYLGAGLFDASPEINGSQYYNVDGDIQQVVYRTGLVGVVVFVVPLIIALLSTIASIARRRLSSAAESLMLTGVVATLACVFSFLGGSVFFWWQALALFPVALIAYATGLPAVAAAASNSARPHHEPGRLASGL